MTAALFLSGCGGSNRSSSNTVPNAGPAAAKGVYGSLPPVGTPTSGGTITVGQLTGLTPVYIFPITPAAEASTNNDWIFQNNMFLPLYNGPTGATPKYDPALSVANPPTFSDGNKTVTFTLKRGFRWSDGKPVVANDVLFFIDLVKAAVKESAANFNNYTPGFFPDNVVSATAKGTDTVVLHLTKAYNPSFFFNNQMGMSGATIYAFPSTVWNVDKADGPHLDFANPANASKIYNYLSSQGKDLATFATNPLWQVVDGPYRLSSFTPSTGAYTFVPNRSYGGEPKPSATIKAETFTSITSQLNALRSDALDVGQIDFSQLGQVNSLRAQGYSVYGLPDFGFYAAYFNFKDGTNHFGRVASQLYVRQAMAHLVDQPAYVSGIFKGAGGPAYGPIPSVPVSPYAPANATTNPYPFSLHAAKQLLTSHGWAVHPGGTTTCQRPGTGAGECGAGIPRGTPIATTYFYDNQSLANGLEAEAFASAAAEIGIKITVTAKTFNFLISTYDDADPADNQYRNAWGLSAFPYANLFYPTTEYLFNTGGVYNFGAYNNPTANALISKSVNSANVSAVRAEASYITSNVPALFQPNGDNIFAVSKKVGGPADGWLAATQDNMLYQYWYLTK